MASRRGGPTQVVDQVADPDVVPVPTSPPPPSGQMTPPPPPEEPAMVYVEAPLLYRVGEPIVVVTSLMFIISVIIHSLRSMIPGGLLGGGCERKGRSKSRESKPGCPRGHSADPGSHDDEKVSYNVVARDTFSAILALAIYCAGKWWVCRPFSLPETACRGYTPRVGESCFIALVVAAVWILYFRSADSIMS